MNEKTKFYAKQLEPLINGTIQKIAHSQVDEFGNQFFGLIIHTANGKDVTLWFLSDDEGNAPGSFDLDNRHED
jgi:hypothetical protein